jgi:DNA-binding NtrC family response regulator
MRFLLVDDDEVYRSCLSEYLTRGGHAVDEAGNGLEALLLLEHDTPDAIISDVQMPEMDGIELLDATRRRFPGIPVILMTGNASFDLAYQALRRHAYHYLRKPFRLTQLQSCIDRLTEESARHTCG